MTRHDPFLRTAIRLQGLLAHPHHTGDDSIEQRAATVQGYAEALVKLLTLWSRCQKRGWHVGSLHTIQRLHMTVRMLQQAVADANHHVERVVPRRAPVLRELLGELLQLEEEFTKVTIDRGVISVITEPVELDDVYLGSFQIELPIAQLVGDRVGSDVFQIIAIEPHPATGSDVVHPHVRDGRLCAGDATVPLASALRDGRLSDAFLTVRSVLNTYNGSSAYVPLHDWNGIACANCESIVSEDDRFYCERCRSDVCNDCYATCDVCGEGCCTSCLEKDRRSNRLCCGECRHRCGGCSRIVDSDSFDDELALCPECRDEREREEQEQQQTEEIHDDDNDDHNGAERTTADAVELAGQSADGPITGGAAEAAEPVSA